LTRFLDANRFHSLETALSQELIIIDMDAAGDGSIDRDDFVVAVQPGVDLPLIAGKPRQRCTV
jgi:hypothetical protein